jgi:hypothetical protein
MPEPCPDPDAVTDEPSPLAFVAALAADRRLAAELEKADQGGRGRAGLTEFHDRSLPGVGSGVGRGLWLRERPGARRVRVAVAADGSVPLRWEDL